MFETMETPSLDPRTTSDPSQPAAPIVTRLSRVDGERGRLLIAGRDIGALANEGFERVANSLLAGKPNDAASLMRTFYEARQRAAELLDPVLARTSCMDAVRAACAGLQLRDTDPWSQSVDTIAAVGLISARWLASAQGVRPLPPSPVGHAEDLLRIARGEAPTQAQVAALDRYLVTVSDHGLNASTFAARVVASTGSDLVSAVTAAIGALKGPLHGGAPGPVLDMLDDIGTAERAEAWLEAELDAGRRIMGMGHRVYRVRDPRAAALESAVIELEKHSVCGDPRTATRLRLARHVEQAAERLLGRRYPLRALRANVEFYTAILLESLAVPRAGFSAVFAAGRVAGWCAHFWEQQATGRLIRPRARYIGPEGI